MVRTYSLGMKQRLRHRGRAVEGSSLLILDEPANGLDPAGIVEVRASSEPRRGGTHGLRLEPHPLGGPADGGSGRDHRAREAGRDRLRPRGPRGRTGTGLLVRVADPASGRSALADAGIEVTVDGDPLRVAVAASDGERVARALAARELFLSLLQPDEGNLEEAFLELTGRDPGGHDPAPRLRAAAFPVLSARGGPARRDAAGCGRGDPDRRLPVHATDGGGPRDGPRPGARRGRVVPRPGLGRRRHPGSARAVLRGQLRRPDPVHAIPSEARGSSRHPRGRLSITTILGLVVGASVVAVSWQTGTISTILTWEPRRLRWFAARILMLAAGVLVMTLAIVAFLSAGLALAAMLRGSTVGIDGAWWSDVPMTTAPRRRSRLDLGRDRRGRWRPSAGTPRRPGGWCSSGRRWSRA